MSKRVLVNVKNENVIKLQDLSPVLREVTEDKQEWVYKYCDRSKIGKAVYEDFIAYNESAMGKNSDQYIFSDELREDGILSMTQAFQILATSLEEFGIGSDSKLGEEAKQRTLRLFDRILDAVIQNDGGFKFDATPYLPASKHFEEENYRYAYIDTVTWVMSAILSMFRLYISGDCELEQDRLEKAQSIYKYCIEYLNKSFINGKALGKFSNGWNYTNTNNDKGVGVPSLYFTFAVSELMIDILTTFENVIRDADIDLIQQDVEKKLRQKGASEEDIEIKKAQAEQRYQKQRENINSGAEEFEREKALFNAINDGYTVYDEESPYSLLESKAKKAADNIWELTKNQLSTEFFSGDLNSTLSETIIEQSLQSDAVFNTIFIINTLINAGLDEDAEDKITYFTVAGSQEYEDALAEYDAIRDTLRIAYDNAYQFYLKMEKKKKEYKINEYTLSFDEPFKKLEDQVNELRKARIRVFSLMPLLVKTKTTLGEFLIQYPQYDMQIYLENILNYRCVRKNNSQTEEYYWTWERSGYSSSSNYYFFSALNDFFAYYEKYEQPASKNAVNNDRARKTVRDEYLKELKRSDGEIGQLLKANKDQQQLIAELNEQIRTLEDKHEKLQEQFNNDPLRKALNDFVCTVVREQILSILSMDSVGTLLSSFSDSMVNAARERVALKAEGATNRGKKTTSPDEEKWYLRQVEQDSETSKLEAGLRSFGSALLSERLLEMLYEDQVRTDIAQEEYPEKAQAVREDIEQAIRHYLAPLAAGQSSDYTATKGYSGLVQILNREKANQKNKNG